MRAFERPFHEEAAVDEALEALTGEEIHCPCGVMRRCLRKIILHRGDLGIGRRRAVDRVVECREALQMSASPSNAVASGSARMPDSLRWRTSDGEWPCVTRMREAPVSEIVRNSEGQSA